MSTPSISLKAKKFRAINSAELIINGITLVAGENGCGKSTISKLLYYSYKTIANYQKLVRERLENNLNIIFTFLEISRFELYDRNVSVKDKKIIMSELNEKLLKLKNELKVKKIDEDFKNSWFNYLDEFSLLFKNTKSEHLLRIANDIAKVKGISDIDDTNPFNTIKVVLDSYFKEAIGLNESRSISIFKNELKKIFKDNELPSLFEVSEFNKHLVSIKKDSLSIPYLIQNVIYIDTPMVVGIKETDVDYWNDLNHLLIKNNLDNFSNLSNLISKDIIKGKVSIDESNISDALDSFSFTRDDGTIFNLLDCATGVKSFSIIQLLINNGSISNKTLMIIDEPESHLHPQWIIEYARLIVLLNKELGVKFFLASHNPDMVSAIRLIAEKENTLDDLAFYLAEKNENYTYNYKYLKQDINPIFKSFNIALDRIDKYGAGDEL